MSLNDIPLDAQVADLSFAQVSDLTPLRELRGLTTLNLSATQVSDLMPLRELSGLTTLILRATQVSDLTPLREVSGLTTLNLSGTRVSDLSPLRELSGLTKLNLSGTRVSDLSLLRELSGLTKLHLSGTQVSDLSPLRELSGLTELDLSGTQVRDLSPLRGLSGLTELSLSPMRVSDLSLLRELSSLTKLHLSGTQVSDLSPLRKLSGLTELHLSDTQVRDLSPLRELSGLTSLSLLLAPVSDLSPLRELSGLTTLSLSFSQVSDLSPLCKLRSLTMLDLLGTPVSDILPLRELSGLRRLNLSRTQVSDLSPLSELRSLTDLKLAFSKVSDLSPLRELSGLTMLDLWGSRVSDLAPLEDLLLAGDLGHLSVNGDTLRAQPPELAQATDAAAAFRSYFHDLRAGAQRNTDLKLAFVGNPHVGKTTLRKRLVEGEPRQGERQERTHGIDAVVWPVSIDGEDFRVTIWDLAGQEIYHTMHRFLLHPRVIFLLLWAEETNEDDAGEIHPATYWLELIRQLGSGSVTVLVKNQIDRSNRFGTRPPELHGIECAVDAEVAVSALRENGLPVLRATLVQQIQRFRDRWGYLVPTSWLAVRAEVERLQAQGTREMPFAHFEQLCVAHGVQDPGVLAEYLNENGLLFHRADFFSNRLVLDQDWLLDKVYAVFDSRRRVRERIVRARGIIRRDDGEWIWPDHEEAERQVFLDFLVAAELAFRTGSCHDPEYVIPSLLPWEAPPFRPPAGQRDLWLELRYPILHRALIERLIVQLSGLSPKRQWWRHGIDIKAPGATWVASVEAPPGTDVLRIHVASDRSHSGSDTIRNGAAAALLELIGRTLPAAKPTLAGSVDGSVFIGLDELARLRTAGAEHCVDRDGRVQEVKQFAGLPLRSDLERSDHRKLPLEKPKMSPDPRKLKIFVSYAHADEAHKDELLKHLKIIKRVHPSIEPWHDRDMFAGTLLDQEIMNRLNVADVTCLLISPDFIASDYCWSVELQTALRRYEEHGKSVVPIIVRKASSWTKAGIGKHLALPRDGKHLSAWKDPDDFWDDVQQGLARLIERELAR